MQRLLTFALASSLGLASSAVSCQPDFGERESHIDRARVLAIRVDPPEAKPGELVTTSLLVASPDGPVDTPPTSWAFCATPKLLTENGAVSAACLANGVTPIGDSNGGVTAALPQNVCFDFGPETQSAEVRPRDPDVTGGYFAPIRARVAVKSGSSADELATAFGFARIECNLANAPSEIAARFRDQYTRNKSPALLPIEARIGGDSAATLQALPRGARVALRASWTPDGAETYALFDRREQLIVTRRESLRVSWFSTAGMFEHDRTGRDDTDPESFSENVWTAPDEPRVTHVWLVLRDSRGGVAFTSAVVTTR